MMLLWMPYGALGITRLGVLCWVLNNKCPSTIYLRISNLESSQSQIPRCRCRLSLPFVIASTRITTHLPTPVFVLIGDI